MPPDSDMNTTKHPCLQPVALPKLTGSPLPVLPCGQCPHCLKRKGAELAFRLYRQLQGRSIYMLTFTYDNEHCPVYKSTFIVDTETGEERYLYSSVIRYPAFFEKAPFEWKRTIKKGKEVRAKRFHPFIEEEPEDTVFSIPGNVIYHRYYQTVFYDDVKRMFKRFRQKSAALSDFICVPEYGGLGYRPHYHLLCCGFSQSDIDSLVNEWPYGSVDVRRVLSLTGQNNDLSAVSNYVAKYATKGKYDCPHIFEGACLKPRRAVSENFGLGGEKGLKELQHIFYRRDLFPGFSPLVDVFPNDDAMPFCADIFNDLPMHEKAVRPFLLYRSLNINGYKYPVPRYIITKLFYKKVKTYERFGPESPIARPVFRLRASELQKSISRHVLRDLVQYSVSQFPEDHWSSEDLVNSFSTDAVVSRPAVSRLRADSSLSSIRHAEISFRSSLENSYY